MSFKLFSENKLIPLFSLILGLAICTSTSLMTISYVILVILALLRPNFILQLKLSFRQKYVLGSVLFYLIFILGVFWSQASAHNVSTMLLRIIGFLLAPLFLIAFTANKSGELLVKGFVIGALISAILSLLSYISNRHILFGIVDNNWVVFHGHILHNAFLAIAANFLLLYIFDNRLLKKERLLYGIIYILFFIDVFFIVSGRTGQVMFVAMSGFILLYRFRFKGILWLVIASLILLPLLYFSPNIQRGIHNYQSDVNHFSQGDVKTSVGERLLFHKVSLVLIKEKPLLGYGTGSFSSKYAAYSNANNIKEMTTNPHRDIYWIGVELGVLGIAVFVLMIFLAIMNVLQLNYFCRGMGLSLILGYLIASIQNSLFIDNVTGLAFIFLILSLIAKDTLIQKQSDPNAD